MTDTNENLRAQKRIEELETAYRKLMDNNIALAKISGDLDKKVERLKRFVKEAADVPNYMRRVMHHPPAMTLKPDSLSALEVAEVYLKAIEARALSDKPDEGTTVCDYVTMLGLKQGTELHGIALRENGYGSTFCGIRSTPADPVETGTVTCKYCKNHMDGTWIKKMAEIEAASEGGEKK